MSIPVAQTISDDLLGIIGVRDVLHLVTLF